MPDDRIEAIRFPAPLRPGATIALTAPSSGVVGPARARLDAAIAYLAARGYRVREGRCLRDEVDGASAAAAERARELMAFLLDPEIAAVLPPWGGELASEVLDRLDFDALAQAAPKWLMGYSDVSTILLPLTLRCGWATAHGPNLMELTAAQAHPLVRGALDVLATAAGARVVQASSAAHQTSWGGFVADPGLGFALDAPTSWRRLDGAREPVEMHGRLIGGCLDTLIHLAGTPYGDVPGFVRRHRDAGSILYLENVELGVPAMTRALLGLRWKGWFDGLSGVLFGRSPLAAHGAGDPDAYTRGLRSVVGSLDCPVLLDVDIGHLPPQFVCINGARARVRFDGDGRGALEQALA